MNKFNPKLSEFIKENPNLTIMGVVWAGWWRIYVTILGVCFAIGFLSAVFNN